MTQLKPPAEINHSDREHAVLSASAADRWINCPPSVALTKDIPDDSSPFAAEGTRAHEIAERCLRAFLNGEPEPEFDEDDYITYLEVHPYVERVIERYTNLKQEDPSTNLFVEVRVEFSDWVPHGFGTSDCIIVSGNTIYVIDLKFGKGVVVDAEGNPQARCYALGAYTLLKDIYDIERIVTVIDQPRLFHYTTEEISIYSLLAWADGVLAPAAQLAWTGQGEYRAGDWCRFCKAGATCRKRAAKNLAVQAGYQSLPDPALLTDDQIALILDRADDLELWVKKLRAYAAAEILNGVEMPGWKVVEGRTNRTITDEKAVARKLRSLGYKPSQMYARKMITVTQLQALLGGRKAMEEEIGDYIGRTEPKPALVRSSDRRPAITNNAIDDFKDL